MVTNLGPNTKSTDPVDAKTNPNVNNGLALFPEVLDNTNMIQILIVQRIYVVASLLQ